MQDRDPHLLVAEGVEFVNAGKQCFVSAKREVILCAGKGRALQSMFQKGRLSITLLRCLPISDDTRAFWYVRHFSVLVIHANASSGIGRKEVLSRYGIETLNDLPGVGENLRE